MISERFSFEEFIEKTKDEVPPIKIIFLADEEYKSAKWLIYNAKKRRVKLSPEHFSLKNKYSPEYAALEEYYKDLGRFLFFFQTGHMPVTGGLNLSNYGGIKLSIC